MSFIHSNYIVLEVFGVSYKMKQFNYKDRCANVYNEPFYRTLLMKT